MSARAVASLTWESFVFGYRTGFFVPQAAASSTSAKSAIPGRR
jgi:hypothetical protein